jgi:CubicO group peptidase (beta-lactamase class C family)
VSDRVGQSCDWKGVGVAVVLSTLAAGPVSAQSTGALSASLDSAAMAYVAATIVPGVSVAVVRGDQVLLQKGYGRVDLEWDVATPQDGGASYEIGSVTKQFTAAAVLLLVEAGKLDLEADFTTYVDYDTHGRTVPLRRLLDHTSGIRSYTEMSVFGELTPMKLPRDTLVRLIEQTPFDFEPGTAQIYNNSAFFLLGLVIEAVSGMSYEDFVAARVFAPAGMNDSYYCSESRIRENRAHGYDLAGGGGGGGIDEGQREARLDRAGYLDHTWPYAAGSLCSTVGDLARWNKALHGGVLLSADSYAAMTTPAPLADGMTIRYAMGIRVDERAGEPVMAHGGGINGFLSRLAWYPEEELSVVVLQNSTGPTGPGALANTLADLVLGPAAEPEAKEYPGDLAPFAGSYRGPARGQAMDVTIRVDGLRLVVEVDGGEPRTPVYRGDLRWDLGDTHLFFLLRDDGVGEMRYDTGGGHYVLRRVDD